MSATNLVAFSIKTKGLHNFTRRLWTVFTRFGISEKRARRALHTVIDILHKYDGAPTFFIPAVVLNRHPGLIAEIANCGAEIGIHGYVHNDYRSLSIDEQFRQAKQAASVFRDTRTPYNGFRNPYLGWTNETLRVFEALGFAYDSNEAILHEVIELQRFPSLLRSGFEKSLALFQAIACNAYILRPHFEGSLLRIPTSIPDDEMLFDRLRLTDPEEVGRIWSRIMERVYELGGIYTLNLHPERALSCKQALDMLLTYARNRPLPVWIARLTDVAQWWKERSQFRLHITPLAHERWRIEVSCTPRATLLARHLTVEDQPAIPWSGVDFRIQPQSCVVNATRYPCIALSQQTSGDVVDFLYEQGYPWIPSSQQEAQKYAWYLDMPEGLGTTREEQIQRRSMLVQQIEQMEEPFLHFGCWPDGSRAALAISGDIDSVTIQDFFLRLLEVHRYT